MINNVNRFDEQRRELDEIDVDKLEGEERIKFIKEMSLSRFKPETFHNTFMYVSIAGFISSGIFKEEGFVRLDYELVEGKDWDFVDVVYV